MPVKEVLRYGLNLSGNGKSTTATTTTATITDDEAYDGDIGSTASVAWWRDINYSQRNSCGGTKCFFLSKTHPDSGYLISKVVGSSSVDDNNEIQQQQEEEQEGSGSGRGFSFSDALQTYNYAVELASKYDNFRHFYTGPPFEMRTPGGFQQKINKGSRRGEIGSEYRSFYEGATSLIIQPSRAPPKGSIVIRCYNHQTLNDRLDYILQNMDLESKQTLLGGLEDTLPLAKSHPELTKDFELMIGPDGQSYHVDLDRAKGGNPRRREEQFFEGCLDGAIDIVKMSISMETGEVQDDVGNVQRISATLTTTNETETQNEYELLEICHRPTNVGKFEHFQTSQNSLQECPPIAKDKPIIILDGRGYGRTGNKLTEFLHAIQETRDRGLQLGVMKHSWVMGTILPMWMAISNVRYTRGWKRHFERSFCIKIFDHKSQLRGYREVIPMESKELLFYRSEVPFGEYMASQQRTIRTLFRNYNTGVGRDVWNQRVRDMCSGIRSLFGEAVGDATYSVIHSRSLEGEPGFRLLNNVARKVGCDPVAALEMRPDYIKSILEPLGLMHHPIVLITDGQNSDVVRRLRADEEIGPLLRTVPSGDSWIGGDITLAIMSDAFIGNPASTFAGFIAKSRASLGFGHSYLFRAKDENGNWRTVCGDHCVFDKTILGVMS